EARRLAGQYFGRIPRGAEPPQIVTTEPEQLGERSVTLIDQAQPLVIVGYHRPSGYHPDDPAFTVLDDVLSAGRTSRFHRALVGTELALCATTLPTFPGEKYPTLFGAYAAPNRGVAPD